MTIKSTLAADTPALGLTRFARLYQIAHGEGAEVPAEVHTADLWAGPDAATDHRDLCTVLRWEALTLDAVGAEGYVLLRGAGDGCDVWARYTTA